MAMKNQRKNFLLPTEMVGRAESIAKELNINLSQMVRRALDEYMKKIEAERIEKEAIEACKFYYELDKQIANDWRSVEGKV